jgi:hypothetical protein
MQLLKDGAVETAIEAGRLKGKMKSGDAFIDESSKRTAAFIQALSDDNFKTEPPLIRLKKF